MDQGGEMKRMPAIKTAIRVVTITAVTAIALSSAPAAKPQAEKPGAALQFELADGTVITGRIDAKTIDIRISSGNVLKIPAAEVGELTVGLNDRPGFVKRVETLIKALTSNRTHGNPMRKLIALGPAARPVVAPYAAGGEPGGRAAIVQVLEAYKRWSLDHPDEPEAFSRPIPSRSKLKADINTFLGTIVAKEFRIATPQGTAVVKLGDVWRIRPSAARGVRIIARRLGRWTVHLHDKTRITGTAVGQSLVVQTRYGKMTVPLARIQYADFKAADKTVSVQCWGPERISGTLEPGATISLKTPKGVAKLPLKKIAAAAYGPLTLRGHSPLALVWCVAFSPDGKRLASGNWDNTVNIWDTHAGTKLRVLKGRSTCLKSVAFSPDGKSLASGSMDHTIKLWDTAAGKELLTLKGHSDQVHSVAFSPDGKSLASGSQDRTVKIWDTAARKQRMTLKGHSGGVWSVAFSPDGRRLASAGSSDKTIRIWDLDGGKELFTLKGHSGWVYSAAFSPDGKSLASGSEDKTIKIWDLASRKELLTLKGHSGYVMSVAFSPDRKRLASGSADRTIKLWDTSTGKEIVTLDGHSLDVWSVVFSPDGKRLASGSSDKTVKIWEIGGWTEAANNSGGEKGK